MTTILIGIVFAALGLDPETAADVVTLRDGKVVLGQVLEPDRRGGPLPVVVRRAWAEANLPERYAGWKKVEDPIVRRAEAQRAARLAAWRRDRPREVDKADKITAWLDAMANRPATPGDGASRLMVIRLNRADVKVVTRRPAKVGRLLRLCWTIDLPDVEAMPIDGLKQALEGRGFAPDLETPVSIDAFLPTPIEADDRWLLRRAATEAAHDPGNRFLRYQGALLPEPAPGEPPPASASLTAAAEAIKGLLGDAPAADPLPARLRNLGSKGRAGAVVTELEMAPDLASVAVRVTLWARVGGPDRWVAGLVRSGQARPNDLPANAGAGLAEDPQVKAAFGLVESLGLGNVSDLKQKGLAMGAATRVALTQARAAIDRDLEALALPLDVPPAAEANPTPRP